MRTSPAPLTATMTGVFLPAQRRVELGAVPVPEPGPGQVLVRMRASAICGSDLRAIYREHLGTGPEAYCGVVAGHEPAGRWSSRARSRTRGSVARWRW